MNSNSLELNIQRFADGGAEGSSSVNAEIAQPQETGAADNTADNGSVAENNSQQGIDFSSYSEEQIEELIDTNPNLKKVIGKRMNNSFGKRLAQEKAKMQEQMKPANNLIERLMIHHDVDNIEDLAEKVNASVREEFALKHGVSEEMSDELINVRVKNRQDLKMREYLQKKEQAEAAYVRWKNEANELLKLYPNFDLETELQNKDFERLLKANVPMQHVYETLHLEELVEAAKKEAASAYAKSTAQMAARPTENGLGNQTAVNGQKDVSKLTKKERAEFAKRALRGEVINFK